MGLLDVFNSEQGRMGLGLLGGGFGQQLRQGVESMDAYKKQQMVAQLQQLQMQRAQAEMADAQEQRKAQAAQLIEQQRQQELFRNAGKVPLNMQGTGAANAMLPEEFRIGAQAELQKPGQIDYNDLREKGMSAALMKQLAEIQTLGLPEVARTIKGMKNGREVEQQYDKFGREVGQGFEQFKAPIMMDRGGQIDAVSPYTAPGATFGKTMTFGDKNAAANLSLSRQRLDLDREKFGFERGNGTAKTTEGEKTAGALLQRLRGSQLQLEDALTGGKTGAEKPSLIAQGMRAVGAEAAANTWNSPERQRVEAAQLDILDAALTLGTGAAYTKEQLEGYRKSYFPQIGDEPATVKDKQDRLQNILSAAEIKAGGAAKSVPSVAEMKALRLKKMAPAGSLGSGSFQILSVE